MKHTRIIVCARPALLACLLASSVAWPGCIAARTDDSQYATGQDLGSGSAMRRLGDQHRRGIGVKPNSARALAFYREAACQLDPFACMHVAEALADGADVPQDNKAARDWFTEALAAFRRVGVYGHPAARYMMGYLLDPALDSRQDLRAGAEWMLGEAYLNGLDTPRDPDDAAIWFGKSMMRYRMAAEAGDAIACCRLGEAFAYGKTGPKDKEESDRWYLMAAGLLRKPAEGGDVWSQYLLGTLYFRGMGLKQDLALGAQWWKKAADGGNVRAMEELGFAFRVNVLDDFGKPLDDKDYPKVVRQHIHWLRLAADKGSLLGCVHMGEAYCGGEGGVVERDPAAGMRWYARAAAGGCDPFSPLAINAAFAAKRILAKAYRAGDGVEKDERKAAELYAEVVSHQRTLAGWGDSWAQFELAEMYEKGDGVPADKAQATAWYEKSAATGNTRAADALRKLNQP